ncbi:GGDEF domain-containing protein [Pseudoalteromonas sp. SSDWG2]|uniref:GGDEF domain-containing protein n=1 Tax=Pseudoalteromonas sp. SSDWG2 TaxID=3139391 RepID=UPI003BA97A56
MMFHDSMANAQDKMTQVCHLLELYALPPTPLNYHVLYSYVSNVHDELNSCFDKSVEAKKTIDSVFMEELHIRFLSKDQKQQTELVERVGDLLGNLQNHTQANQQHLDNYHQEIDRCTQGLDENDPETTRHYLHKIAEHTLRLRKQTILFKQMLERVKQQYLAAKSQLQHIKRQHNIDPLTGLYHRHYLNKQAQMWFEGGKKVSVICVEIENYQTFCQNYGDLIGNLMLEKVASKIQKYTKESGCSGRTQSNEFTILLADIDAETTQVIAEKVRTGISKLRFVSSRSGQSLPSVAFSCHIAHRTNEPNLSELIAQSTRPPAY